MQTSSEIAHLTNYAQRRQMQQMYRRPLSPQRSDNRRRRA